MWEDALAWGVYLVMAVGLTVGMCGALSASAQTAASATSSQPAAVTAVDLKAQVSQLQAQVSQLKVQVSQLQAQLSATDKLYFGCTNALTNDEQQLQEAKQEARK